MIGVLKNWDCVDHDPIEAWLPDDPSHVDFWMNVAIGPPDELGADNFQIWVTTADRSSWTPAQRHGLLYVEAPYAWAKVVAAVHERLAACEGRDWSEIAALLARGWVWEYDGIVM